MTKEPTAGAHDGRAALFDAVHDGADNAVVRLLRAGTAADVTDEDGQTPLYLAAVSDEVGIVRLLLAAGAVSERASGPDAGDLPLCGAAVGGHTEVVRALLAAGARPDLPESYGFTAMAWAVGQGHTGTVEVLLEYGADPDLPGPGGEPPLVLAARRGSPSTVRALLRHGAGTGAKEAALAEARQWLVRDVERELREGLLQAFGEGDGEADGERYETYARRIEEDGGVTVVVELLRDGTPLAGNERQTGHGAIATLLEGELGISTPYAELAERALRCGDPGRDDWVESMTALRGRGDEETFQAAAAWCASDDPMRQAFAADVLAQLGFRAPVDGSSAYGPVRPFAARALPLLRELSRQARDAELIQAVVLGLGHHGDPGALPEILRHAGHPDAEVRHRVALALCGLVSGDHAEGVETLIALSRDADTHVRDWATTALAGVESDAHEVREALAARLNDPDADTAAEAARGLAMRQDPRAAAALARILADEDPDGYARETALEAVGHVRDEQLRRRLEQTAPRCR
ncbi:ankyrin repeat domain-containing protein [Streptomyces lunaelactis]|uniref:ankyrin repeat domain-containing protein n=1 Tax=Streptomyces lunaelactis TaxID=1535768 RepID=UPI001584B7E1|nr:ankyrin repeat domain-containing protein [Streptomyces lunaelactis]NUK07886.1 ankyrin repeat domain-containing protein [Streptomyces lunaelactis]NUK49778.1 ankyrin repeat domain-containing protein [Streptomyces lunaelactis]NUK58561.1 ankyrin repeat domain-containing protein [Streptomyces lunaelactis]NUK66829.1 ankyrin repeat domain-containing protein [Streptomyces lunaelactis]NUK73246.1 ankyrin repeat domain-containing protein [Streptomyces lunaelactis]